MSRTAARQVEPPETTTAGSRRPEVVQRACACGPPGACRCRGNRRPIQAKVAVGPPADRYEQEADRVAARVTSGGGASVAPTTGETARVGRVGTGSAAADHVELPPASGGSPLPTPVRSFMEPRLGADFGAVRVHTGERAAAASSDLGARAFTSGPDIWLGRGESATDHRLMAHELTHVVQQGAATGAASEPTTGPSIVQRQPACGSSEPPTTVDLYAVHLGGSSRDAPADVTQANGVWAQCAIQFNMVGGESWGSDLLDDLDPKGVLNEYTSMASPTAEELKMLGYQPGGAGVIHVYYVPGLSDGHVGENFRPSVNPDVPRAAVVTDGAHVDSLAHELGHILLDVSGHEADRDNLMARGRVRNKGVDKLECAQCGRL